MGTSENSFITNCHNIGFPSDPTKEIVIGCNSVGGIVGNFFTSTPINYFLSKSGVIQGKISGHSFIGSIVGFVKINGPNSKMTLSELYAKQGVVVNSNNWNTLGGLVGIIESNNLGNISVSNSYARCNITAGSPTSNIGGFVGKIFNSTMNPSIIRFDNCYSSNSITANGSDISVSIGKIDSGNIDLNSSNFFYNNQTNALANPFSSLVTGVNCVNLLSNVLGFNQTIWGGDSLRIEYGFNSDPDLCFPRTNAPTTLTPSTFQPSTLPPSTNPPSTNPPSTLPPSTNPPSTNPPSTNPPSTNPPSTNPPSTNPPSTLPPSTNLTSTNPPSTNPPSTNPPSTNPPSTNPPSTLPPSTNLTSTNPPSTNPPSSTQTGSTLSTNPPSNTAIPETSQFSSTNPPETTQFPSTTFSTANPPPSTLSPSNIPSTIPPQTNFVATSVFCHYSVLNCENCEPSSVVIDQSLFDISCIILNNKWSYSFKNKSSDNVVISNNLVFDNQTSPIYVDGNLEQSPQSKISFVLSNKLKSDFAVNVKGNVSLNGTIDLVLNERFESDSNVSYQLFSYRSSQKIVISDSQINLIVNYTNSKCDSFSKKINNQQNTLSVSVSSTLNKNCRG